MTRSLDDSEDVTEEEGSVDGVELLSEMDEATGAAANVVVSVGSEPSEPGSASVEEGSVVLVGILLRKVSVVYSEVVPHSVIRKDELVLLDEDSNEDVTTDSVDNGGETSFIPFSVTALESVVESDSVEISEDNVLEDTDDDPSLDVSSVEEECGKSVVSVTHVSEEVGVGCVEML